MNWTPDHAGNTPPKGIHPRGHEISWAGEGGPLGDFCFGTEDGSLLFLDSDSTNRGRIPAPAEPAEAVNGVAFFGRHFAVSDRSQVAFLDRPAEDGSAAPGPL